MAVEQAANAAVEGAKGVTRTALNAAPTLALTFAIVAGVTMFASPAVAAVGSEFTASVATEAANLLTEGANLIEGQLPPAPVDPGSVAATGGGVADGSSLMQQGADLTGDMP